MSWRGYLLPVVLIAACLGPVTPALAAPDTLITFDDQSVGTVFDQNSPYASDGIYSGRPFSDAIRTQHSLCTQPGVIANYPGAAPGDQVLESNPSCRYNIKAWDGHRHEALDPYQMGGFVFTLTDWRSRFELEVANPDIRCPHADGSPCGDVRLTAWDVNGSQIAQTSSAMRSMFTHMSVTTGGAETIAFVTVDSSEQVKYADNVTMDNPDPANQPTPYVQLQASGAANVAQGGSTTVDVHLLRFNGSVGPVQLALAGLPDTISPSFNPQPMGGNASTLTLTALYNAPLGPIAATLTGTSQSALVGADPAPVPLTVDVKLPYEWARVPVNPIAVTPCSPSQASLSLYVDSSLQNPIFLSASAPKGVTATVTPKTFYPGFNSAVTVDISSDPGAAPGSVKVSAVSPGYASAAADIHVVPGSGSAYNAIDGPIDSERHAATTGYRVDKASKIFLGGTGWCSPMTVSFGGSQPIPVKLLGANKGEAQLPLDALSGNVTLQDKNGATLNAGYLRVDSYRNTKGFRFTNPAPFQLSSDDMRAVFGTAKVDVIIDPCVALTFAIAHCDGIDTGVLRPGVGYIVDQWNAANTHPGNCFGVSVEDLRLLMGADDARHFGSADADAFNIPVDQPAAPRADMLAAIHYWQAAGISKQAVDLENRHPADVAQLVSWVQDALDAGTPPLIGFSHGSDGGHAVAAYNVRRQPGGGVVFDVYNPNIPWAPGEALNPQLHGTNETNSQFVVKRNGNWSSSSPNWTGPVTDVQVIPYDRVPTPGYGELPSANGIETIYSNSGAMTDGSGRPVREVTPALRGPGPRIALGRVSGGPYRITPGTDGRAAVLGGTFAASIRTTSPVLLDPVGPVLDARGRTATVSVSLDRNGSERTVTVSGPAGARVGFTHSGESVELASAAPVNVTLSTVGRDNGSVVLGRLTPAGGATLTADWSRLQSSPISITSGTQRGILRGHPMTGGRPSIGRIRWSRNGRRLRAVVSLKVTVATAGSAFVLLARGRRSIASGHTRLLGRRGLQTLSVALGNVAPGTYRVLVAVLTVNPTGLTRSVGTAHVH